MINRTLIRTRALQSLYSHRHSGNSTVRESLQHYQKSLDSTYALYLYLLNLLPSLVRLEENRIEAAKNKHLATEQERNPNLRFIQNQLVAKLDDSRLIAEELKARGLSVVEDTSLLRHLLNEIKKTDFYEEYMSLPNTSWEEDRQLWVKAFSQVLARDPELAEHLEGLSLYWDNGLCSLEKIECENGLEDIDKVEEVVQEAIAQGLYQPVRMVSNTVEIVKDFVLKTLKKIEPEDPIDEQLLPMFKAEEDEHFSQYLFRQAILNYEEYRGMLGLVLSENWDQDRLAVLDELIMILAITEFLGIPNIPTVVTINEYVELSKDYSTPKSSAFINGMLDALVAKLKEERKILKQ